MDVIIAFWKRPGRNKIVAFVARRLKDRKVIRKVVIALLACIALTFAVSRYASLQQTAEYFEDFRLSFLPAVLASVVVYYILKSIRWQFFLREAGIVLPLRVTILVYLSGQWFAFSPMGEFVKAYLLGRYGVDFRLASSSVVAQTLIDFLSLAVLGSISLLWFPSLAYAVLPFAALLFLGVLLLHQRGFWRALDRWLQRIRLLRDREICLDDALHDARVLTNVRPLLTGLALGLPATLVGSLTLFLVAMGHFAPVDMAQSTFVYSLSQLLGAMSMLPHGLGAVEGGALALFANSGLQDEALAASIIAIFRLASVVWGVGVGGLALLTLPFLRARPALSLLEAEADAAG